jgi:hypothetical protein
MQLSEAEGELVWQSEKLGFTSASTLICGLAPPFFSF